MYATDIGTTWQLAVTTCTFRHDARERIVTLHPIHTALSGVFTVLSFPDRNEGDTHGHGHDMCM